MEIRRGPAPPAPGAAAVGFACSEQSPHAAAAGGPKTLHRASLAEFRRPQMKSG